jgi:hypothetical protein
MDGMIMVARIDGNGWKFAYVAKFTSEYACVIQKQ